LLLGAARAQYVFVAAALAPEAPEAEKLRAGYQEVTRSRVCCPEEASFRAGCRAAVRAGVGYQAALADAALVEERLAACLADAPALPAWCAGFPDASARAGRSADFPAAVAQVAPAAVPVEPMADAEPAGCSAHYFPAR
jgi:hypothetical protein